MNFLKLLQNIKIKFSVHKTINSIRNYNKDKRKRQDLEQIRNKKELANFADTCGQKEFAQYFKKEAKIIENTKED